MKQNERRHLKENELAHSLSSISHAADGQGKQVVYAVVGVLVLLVAVLGFNAFRQRGEAQGQQLLAEAMVALNARVVPTGAAGEDGAPAAAQMGATGSFPTESAKLTAAIPKLQAAADGARGTVAGTTARYHLASALAAVGRHADAISAFDEVAASAGANTLYGRMARMGKADAQSRAGQTDAAIASWKELVAQGGADLPKDALLMELARAYRAKGDAAEAKKTLSQLVDEHANSPYAPMARAEIETISGS